LKLPFRWHVAALTILALICSSNPYVLATSSNVSKSSRTIATDELELVRGLLVPMQNVTSGNQTQNTTAGEPGNATGFPQMPLPPVSEPKSSRTDYLSIAAIAATIALVTVVLLRFRRKKSI
jgi:hypothetical protein